MVNCVLLLFLLAGLTLSFRVSICCAAVVRSINSSTGINRPVLLVGGPNGIAYDLKPRFNLPGEIVWMERLSPDAVRKVLSRLPATILLDTGQYVCKSWRELIRGDPSFANEQLSAASTSSNPDINNGDGFLLHHMKVNDTTTLQKSTVPTKHLPAAGPPSSIFTYVSLQELVHNINEMTNYRPIAIHKGRLSIPLSCDGLLLVSPGPLGRTPAYICNPLLGERTILPPSSDAFFVYVGFAFDALSKQQQQQYYKVFRKGVTRTHSPHGFRWVFEVCSVDVAGGSTSGWRRFGTELEVHPFRRVTTRKGLAFNGKLLWTTNRGGEGDGGALVLSIDVHSETIASMACPRGLRHVRFPFVMSGCLAVYNNAEEGGEIWVMREYGDVESWTREDHVGPMPCDCWGIAQMGGCEGDPEGLLCCVADDRMGFRASSEMGSDSFEGPFHYHDLRTGRNRHAKLTPIDGHRVVEFLEYTPSLLSLPKKFEVVS